MKHILVTGATGPLGYELVRQLRSLDCHVVLICRDPSAIDFDVQGAKVAQADLERPDTLRRVLRGVDTVFHAAGLSERWVKDRTLFFRVNSEGTANLVEASLSRGVEHFIHVSTIDLFDAKSGIPFDENCPQKVSYRSLYTRSKKLAEEAVVEGQKRGLRCLYIYPAALYGAYPHSRHWLVKFARDLWSGKLLFLPPGGMPFVATRDLAEATIRAAQGCRWGERFILSDRFVTFTELSGIIALAGGLTSIPKPLSAPVSRMGAALSHLASALRGKPPYIYKRYLDYWLSYNIPDTGKARRLLGWSPTPIDVALPEMLSDVIPTEPRNGPYPLRLRSAK